MARWVRGPYDSLETLFDGITEALLEDRDQLFKFEVASDKERSGVVTNVGNVNRMKWSQSGETETLYIFFTEYDDDYVFLNNTSFMAGVKFWVEE